MQQNMEGFGDYVHEQNMSSNFNLSYHWEDLLNSGFADPDSSSFDESI
jgi:hypothetical protein